MSERIPVVRIGSVLLVSIRVEIHDRIVLRLQDELAGAISAAPTRGVLIDVSGVEIIDSFLGRLLAEITELSRLLGAETIVCGMRPAVAITLVELGLEMEGVRTALDVDRGLAILGESSTTGRGEGAPSG